MSARQLDPEVEVSHRITKKVLDDVLHDFGLDRNRGKSIINLVGSIPEIQGTNSEHVNMTLTGAVPSLANAIAATQIFEARGGQPQDISVDLRRAHNYLDPDIGMTPTLNGQEITLDLVAGNPFLFGIYETADKRHVVPSAVYVDLVYQWSTFLQCAPNQTDVAASVLKWTSRGEHDTGFPLRPPLIKLDLERAAEIAGLPLAVVQTTESWRETEQGRHMASLSIVPITQVCSSPPKPLSLKPKRPLEGLKVLCVTHAIAGPSAGRTLAEYGASVLQIMYTHGFEHPFVYTYANLGCASSRLSFHKECDRSQMWRLIRDADVWIDSYRDGALSRFGFTDEALHNCNPSLIVSHVRVYGTCGPWASKPGFDMQGSASSGMMALCGGGLSAPAWPPGQVINDYTTGYYGTLAIQATVLRRMKEGGGYVLSPSLTGTAMSIVKHFNTSNYLELRHNKAVKLPPKELEGDTGIGILKTLQPLPELSKTPLGYNYLLLSAMGSDLPVFPGYGTSYETEKVHADKKEEVLKSALSSTEKRLTALKQVRARFISMEAATHEPEKGYKL